MRIAALSLMFVIACASTDPPPKVEAAAPTPVEPAPVERTPVDVQPSAGVNVTEVSLHCNLGLTPPSASDGRREVKRSVELRHDFAMVRIAMSGPPDRAYFPAKSADALAQVRAHAAAAHASPRPIASAPVPDGSVCRLRMVVDGNSVEERVDPTPASGPLADLVLELRRWMHESEPAWPAKTDPDVAACRGAANRADIDRFHVREIVIERDGGRRWEFLDPKELSTGNHFGCRMQDGKPLILPEG